MCVFDASVSVGDTNILVAPLRGAGAQLTVYSNSVGLPKMYGLPQPWMPGSDTHMRTWGDGTGLRGSPAAPADVAMVLPVPLHGREAGSVSMVDLSADPRLFDDLAAAIERPRSRGAYLYGANALSKGSGTLEVRTCGPYRYTVVPDGASFGRLDESLSVRGPTAELMARWYPSGFSFLVCKMDLRAGGMQSFSPVAYVHPAARDGSLFVPALHAHGGEGAVTADADDWDHSVFAVGARDPRTALTDGRLLGVEPRRADPTRLQELQELRSPVFRGMDWAALTLRRIKGRHPNGDITLT